MSDSEPKPERPKPDPRALTPEYHKARKQLMLWAGILFIWELVGIDLEKAQNAGGNAGALVKSIKSPQAVPWVFLILLAYFLFKTTIEWYQCSVARRSLRVSRIDFTSAWIVSLLAFALYVGQAISRVQFANVVKPSVKVGAFLVAGFAAFMFVGAAVAAGTDIWRRERLERMHSILIVVMIAAIFASTKYGLLKSPRWWLIGSLIGTISATIATIRDWKRQSELAKLAKKTSSEGIGPTRS
jgi:hypothetical protein